MIVRVIKLFSKTTPQVFSIFFKPRGFFDARHFLANAWCPENLLGTMKIYENLKIPLICFLFVAGNLDDFIIHHNIFLRQNEILMKYVRPVFGRKILKTHPQLLLNLWYRIFPRFYFTHCKFNHYVRFIKRKILKM